MRTTGLVLPLLLSAAIVSANTYTVTSTADSGAGTLRQPILDANANPGADTISFNITGSGPHIIAPTSALTDITDAVTVDGYPQTGSSPNTNPIDQGLNTVLQIVLDGNDSAGAGPGLNATVDGVTIRGLVIHRWHTAAIRLGGPNGVAAGNYLGIFTDVPCPGTFTNWVEELYNENIAAGCGGGGFCPTSPNNRGQMAVFITRTFNLP